MGGIKAVLALGAVLLLGVFLKDRRSTAGVQKAIEANWKDIKKHIPDDWAKIAPKKEAQRFVDSVHKATGESRRRIRRTLHDLTA